MNKKILALLLGVALFPVATVEAQDAPLQGRATPQVAASHQLSQKIADARGWMLCPAEKGVLAFGQPVTAFLGDEGSCLQGNSWIDVWTFTATENDRLRVTYSSGIPSVAAIQDYTTGTVLASSSDVCGDLANDCTFEYTVPGSGRYVLGFGALARVRYTLSITLLRGTGDGRGVNFVPYAPAGWGDRIVVSNVRGTHTDSPKLLDTDTLYVDWAVMNAGTLSRAYVDRLASLSLDGVLLYSWPSTYPLDPNEYAYVDDYSIGSLSPGTHTLEIEADPDNDVPESEEADNEYVKTIVVVSAAEVTCVANASTLCLGGRFAVTVDWTTPDGRSGQGKAIGLTEETGYFWFFDYDNVELCLKVLDARAINGHFWVFYGGLSNVQYTITVTDTTNTAATKTYVNPQGTMASVADTHAF